MLESRWSYYYLNSRCPYFRAIDCLGRWALGFLVAQLLRTEYRQGSRETFLLAMAVGGAVALLCLNALSPFETLAERTAVNSSLSGVLVTSLLLAIPLYARYTDGSD